MIFQVFQLPEIILYLQLYWPLKEDFCVISQKNFKSRHFMGHSDTDFQLQLNSKSSKLPSFDNLLKNMLKINILNLKRNGHFFKFCVSIIYVIFFLTMINLCPNILFIKNSKCQQFFHLKKEPPKKHKFFIFLKGCFFVMGSPIDMNVDIL